jgi:hypothetical protein
MDGGRKVSVVPGSVANAIHLLKHTMVWYVLRRSEIGE